MPRGEPIAKPAERATRLAGFFLRNTVILETSVHGRANHVQDRGEVFQLRTQVLDGGLREKNVSQVWRCSDRPEIEIATVASAWALVTTVTHRALGESL